MKSPRLRLKLHDRHKEEHLRPPTVPNSVRHSRMNSQGDLANTPRLDFDSPVKARVRTKSTTHSPETSVLNRSLRLAVPRVKLLKQVSHPEVRQ
jgi:hypothetical protein